MNPTPFLLAAYKQLGGRADITSAKLHAEADGLYIVWRNCQIEAWATAVHAKHGHALLKYEEKLLDMIARVDEDYYGTLASSELEDTTWELAWCTAVLRWHYAVAAGRVAELLPVTVAETAVWLENMKALPVGTPAGQMSLFFGG